PTTQQSAQGRCRGQTTNRNCARKAPNPPPGGPATLHCANRLAPVLRPDDLADENGGRGPFAAETEAHGRAENQKLRRILCEAAEKGENREPRDGDLQRAHAAEAVG